MTPNQRKHAEDSIRAYVTIDADTKRLIALANFDLYTGPVTDNYAYPGFSKACALIAKALPDGDLWVDLEGDYVGDTEPQWCSESDDDSEGYYPEAFACYERRDVIRVLVGGELAPYVS